ncbi:hypothetical protein [Stenotrophomonas rhizophila]
MSAVAQRFLELALEVERIESECLEQPIEPALEAVLDYVLAHPECRADLVAAFIHIAHGRGIGPPELIEYCMHALRWGEVRQYLADWLAAEGSERVRHYLRNLLMSFDDDWRHANMYARFAGGLDP